MLLIYFIGKETQGLKVRTCTARVGHLNSQQRLDELCYVASHIPTHPPNHFYFAIMDDRKDNVIFSILFSKVQ